MDFTALHGRSHWLVTFCAFLRKTTRYRRRSSLFLCRSSRARPISIGRYVVGEVEERHRKTDEFLFVGRITIHLRRWAWPFRRGRDSRNDARESGDTHRRLRRGTSLVGRGTPANQRKASHCDVRCLFMKEHLYSSRNRIIMKRFLLFGWPLKYPSSNTFICLNRKIPL